MNTTQRRDRQNPEDGRNPLSRFRNELDSLFDRFVRDPWGSITGTLREGPLAPRLDVAEGDDELTFRVELPGVKPEDIHIDVTGDQLTLRGEKCAQSDEKGRDFRYCETEYGSFSRTVQLPASVDPDNIDASYNDGILLITLKKRPDAKPKRIPVRATPSASKSPSVSTSPSASNSPSPASQPPPPRSG